MNLCLGFDQKNVSFFFSSGGGGGKVVTKPLNYKLRKKITSLEPSLEMRKGCKCHQHPSVSSHQATKKNH